MATGKDAGTTVTPGKKDNAQGSPRAVDKSPNFPVTDDSDPSTVKVDNAPNATGADGDDLATDDTEQHRADAYEYAKGLSQTEGKDIEEDSDDYAHAQFLVGEDLAFISTTQRGQEVKKQAFATEKGYDKLSAKEDAIDTKK